MRERVDWALNITDTYDIKDTNNLRLNFSSVDEKMIETGIKRLAEAINEVLD